MSLLTKFESILYNGQKLWEETEPATVFVRESYDSYEKIKEQNKNINGNIYINNPETPEKNKLIFGDNLPFCKYLVQNGECETIKLIYCDPPFFSKVDYTSDIKLKTVDGGKIPIISQNAYDDSWEQGMEEYLIMLTARLYAFHELLSKDGTIWIHLDWHVVHYVKIIMDELFGEENFVNEIIWNYKSGGATKRRFARKHDNLLFYSKGGGYYFKPQQEKSYNRALKPYRFKGVKEYRDETGWYTLVNMKDVWQIDMVGRTSAERTGYATQKPEALLSRIIESCTEKGDLCADFFAGSGTLAATADKMDRRWLSCDMGKLSTVSTLKRMLKCNSSFEMYTAVNDSEVGPIEQLVPENALDAEFFIEKSPSSDMKYIKVELTGYTLGHDDVLPVNKNDLSQIRKIEKEDWLQLIDFFSVDFDYDGKLFKPDICRIKENVRIDKYIEKLIPSSEIEEIKIMVKVIDIFGHSSFVFFNKDK